MYYNIIILIKTVSVVKINFLLFYQNFTINNVQTGDTEISLDDVDHVISALPSHDLTRVLQASSHDADLHKLSKWLSEIHFVDVAVVHVEFDGPPEKNLPSLGFGHLVPKTETSNLLGVIYDSCLFPEQNRYKCCLF